MQGPGDMERLILERTIGWISRGMLVVGSLLAMFLAFVILVDVIGRSMFNSPLRGTAEIVASSIVVICYLQVTYAIASGGMMQVTVFTSMMPVRLRAVVGVFTCLLGVLLFWIVTKGSISGFQNAWVFGSYEGEGALRVPTWPVRLAVLVGSALAMVAYGLLALQHLVTAITGRERPDALIAQ